MKVKFISTAIAVLLFAACAYAQQIDVKAFAWQMEVRDEGWLLHMDGYTQTNCYTNSVILSRTYFASTSCQSLGVPDTSWGRARMHPHITNFVLGNDGKTYRLWCAGKTNSKDACRGLDAGALFHATIKKEYMQLDKRTKYYIADILGPDGHSLTPVQSPQPIRK